MNYGSKHGESFALKLMEGYLATSCAEEVTNKDYEGELTAVGNTVNINSIETDDWKKFTGADFVYTTPTEYPSRMVADQSYAIHFKIGTLDRLQSWIKNPEGTLIQRSYRKLKNLIDKDVFSHYTDVAAGNWIGVDYKTGTVAVAAGTGVVTGSGTAFTSDMVGKPFKAVGHSKWYRIKAYTSPTSITIENDADDVASAYDGGAISAGAGFTIQAHTPITLTKDNIFSTLVQMQTILDINNVPAEDRNAVLPPEAANLLITSTELDRGSLPPEEFVRLKKKGLKREYTGFNIYSNNNMTKDHGGATFALGIQKDWMTFGMALTESDVVDLQNNFGKGYKGLAVWGRKVADLRRKAGVVLYCKVS